MGVAAPVRRMLPRRSLRRRACPWRSGADVRDSRPLGGVSRGHPGRGDLPLVVRDLALVPGVARPGAAAVGPARRDHRGQPTGRGRDVALFPRGLAGDPERRRRLVLPAERPAPDGRPDAGSPSPLPRSHRAAQRARHAAASDAGDSRQLPACPAVRRGRRPVAAVLRMAGAAVGREHPLRRPGAGRATGVLRVGRPVSLPDADRLVRCDAARSHGLRHADDRGGQRGLSLAGGGWPRGGAVAERSADSVGGHGHRAAR